MRCVFRLVIVKSCASSWLVLDVVIASPFIVSKGRAWVTFVVKR
jgi:hypothetical protein